MRNPQSFYSNYITLLLRADTIARYQQSLGISTNIAGLESASELATRLLVSITEWAKNIPFFSELTLPDQSILLRSCWSELFILNAAQHCSPFHMAQPLTISALTSPSNTEMLTAGSNGPLTTFDSAENLRLFEEQVEKLKNLHIDSAEFCCLKAIILFNPGKWSKFLYIIYIEISIYIIFRIKGLRFQTWNFFIIQFNSSLPWKKSYSLSREIAHENTFSRKNFFSSFFKGWNVLWNYSLLEVLGLSHKHHRSQFSYYMN